MIENEELSDEQIRELSGRLGELQTELEAALEESRKASKPVELDQQSVGRLSRMDAIQQQQMADAAKRNQELRLRRVQAALEAVDEGEYGFCRRCEEPIGYPRLRAQPESPFCISCQRRGPG